MRHGARQVRRWPARSAPCRGSGRGAGSNLAYAGWARHAGSAFTLVRRRLLGFAYAAWRADVRLADALPPEWEGKDIALVGVIDDLPQVTERGKRFAFAVERVETPRAIVPRRLSLAWYGQWQKGGATDEVPDLAAGERWRLVVRLKRPHGNVNPGGFDLEAWLLENGLRATGYVRREARTRGLPPSRDVPAITCSGCAPQCVRAFSPHFPPRDTRA